MASEQRIGMWCFVAWCVAVASVVAIALSHGVEPSVFLHEENGRVSSWQALVFSISMSTFGFWMALTTRPRRIPEDPWRYAYNLMMYAKVGGWIFAIGGIISAIRTIGLLQSE